MNRLWVRLTLAFAVVVLVAVGIAALLGSFSAGEALRYYVAYSAMMPHETLVDALAAHDEEHGGWPGAGRTPDPAAGDQIAGLTNAAGDRIATNTPGHSVCLLALDNTTWAAYATAGTWVDAD